MSNNLQTSLRIKAGVMEMGERIKWGSDTLLMHRAADRIDRLEAHINDISGAVKQAFRDPPVPIDGNLLVRIADYNSLVDLFNAIHEEQE